MKVSLVSLGCDKNLVDSEIMLGILQDTHTLTNDYSDSDIIIINTCGFIMDATSEAIETILEIAEHKRTGKCKGLIVTGCMAERYKDEIFNELPEVDAVIGTSNFPDIKEVIDSVINEEKVSLFSDINKNLSEELGYKRVLSTGHYGYLKIAEGCDCKCTFCTIPKLRGKFRSRSIETLIKEATHLADNGLKELILVAQDTSLYGTDIYGEQRLHTLLNELSKIEGIKWIRILYCYPENIYPELIEEMKINEKVCKYIDMPIQHSSDKILKLMGRKSRKAPLKQLIHTLREEIPDITIRTTLIVGFPNETEDDFNELIEFVEEMKFDRLGVFPYSKEEDTIAYSMDNHVDDEIKEYRKNYIMDTQQNISREISKKYLSKTLEVMVDGRLPEEDIYIGRTSDQLIELDGNVFFKCSYEVLSGDFVNVVINETHDYDLIGVEEYGS